GDTTYFQVAFQMPADLSLPAMREDSLVGGAVLRRYVAGLPQLIPQDERTATVFCCRPFTAGEWVLKAHKGEVSCLAFSDDGAVLATGGSDGSVKLWRVSSGQALATLNGHSDPVRALAFAPNRQTLASGGDDSRVVLWDLATMKRRATLRGFFWDGVAALA